MTTTDSPARRQRDAQLAPPTCPAGDEEEQALGTSSGRCSPPGAPPSAVAAVFDGDDSSWPAVAVARRGARPGRVARPRGARRGRRGPRGRPRWCSTSSAGPSRRCRSSPARWWPPRAAAVRGRPTCSRGWPSGERPPRWSCRSTASAAGLAPVVRVDGGGSTRPGPGPSRAPSRPTSSLVPVQCRRWRRAARRRGRRAGCDGRAGGVSRHVPPGRRRDPATVPARGSSSRRTPVDAAVRRALLVGAALLASEQVGVAERCLEDTVAYLKQRRQFGRVLAGYQALKHRLADLLHRGGVGARGRAYAAAAAGAGRPGPAGGGRGRPGLLLGRRGARGRGVRAAARRDRDDVGAPGAPATSSARRRTSWRSGRPAST